MSRPNLNEEGLFQGNAYSVQRFDFDAGPFGSGGYGVVCVGRTILGVFRSKEVANGVAATFDALTPEGHAPEEAPIDALLDLVGFRQILADVVEREAKRLAAEELATRAAANRLRGRRWP